MDARWFAEDRKLPPSEVTKAKQETEKALRNSTIMSRGLKRILEAEVEKTYANEESYKGTDWERQVFGLFQRRKTLKEIIKLLP